MPTPLPKLDDPSPNSTPYTPQQLSREAAALYPASGGAPTVLRLMQTFRPYICPFDMLLPLLTPGGTLLDVGCGGGLWLGLCAKLGLIGSGVGFDSSPAAVGTAKAMQAMLKSRGECLNFEHRSVQDGWPTGTFDTVSIIDVMHHVPVSQQAQIIAEAAKHLRPGGILLYKDIDGKPLFKASMNRLHDLVMARQWIHYAPAEKVIDWATAAGLDKLAHMDMHRVWYPHELLVFGKPK